MSFLLLIVGLAVLLISGELLVRGAAGLALKFKISPLIIGLTIVSFGTSAPELLVCVEGALAGLNDIVVGNIIGSNIANLALVLGLTSIVFPLAIDKYCIKIDWPFMMLATLLFTYFAFDQELSHIEGLVFFSTLIGYLLYLFFFSKKHRTEIEDETGELENQTKGDTVGKLLLFIVPACFGLYFGANWFLEGATGVAKMFGVSDRIIGLTVVAFGTSVPELVTSMLAAFRKQAGISIGNLVGSNIFNLLGVLGVTALIKPIPVSSDILVSDIYWMLFVSALLFPLMLIGKKLNWWKGLLLFLLYIVYVVFTLSA